MIKFLYTQVSSVFFESALNIKQYIFMVVMRKIIFYRRYLARKMFTGCI